MNSSSPEWFLTRPSATYQPARIFCFAHAGGNPRTFLGWQPSLEGDAEIVAVCPPGRAHRASEPQPSLTDYVQGAAAAIAEATAEDARPSYLFGHSLGALVAFEVARLLNAQTTVGHLVISALAAPSLLPSARVRELAGLHGKAFAEALVFFGGMPPEVLAEEELHELLLPAVMADFRMAAEYRYQPGEPLAIAATLVTGTQDPHVGAEELRGWRAEFQNPTAERWVEGGHFYFEPKPTAITSLLGELARADQHVEMI